MPDELREFKETLLKNNTWFINHPTCIYEKLKPLLGLYAEE